MKRFRGTVSLYLVLCIIITMISAEAKQEKRTENINTDISSIYGDDYNSSIENNERGIIDNWVLNFNDYYESCMPQKNDLTSINNNETPKNHLRIFENNEFVFDGNLLTNFNTVVAPETENGAGEPKYSYNDFIEENISDYSGELTLNFEDLNLAGRNGLDLRIGRTYQSVAANIGEKVLMVLPNQNGYLRNTLVTDYSSYMVDRYNLGVGWGFSFPSVQIETEYVPEEISGTYYYDEESELYYHTGNGEVYKVEFTSDETDSNLKGYYKKDIQFNKNDTAYSNGQVSSYYSLTLADKTKQYFAEDGRLI